MSARGLHPKEATILNALYLKVDAEAAERAEQALCDILADLAAAHDALRRYGYHLVTCPRWPKSSNAPCNCGYAALAAGTERNEETPEDEAGSSAADVDGPRSPAGPQRLHESVGERQGGHPASSSGARAAVSADTPEEKCPGCGGDAGCNWFDRSLCGCREGGVMHMRCSNCGTALDGCECESFAPPPDPPAVSPDARLIGREGMVAVYDHEGRYLGCMGSETWRILVAHPALDAYALAAVHAAGEGDGGVTCGKCGSADTHTRWHGEGGSHTTRRDNPCREYGRDRGKPVEEHLHHTCRNCGFDWTDDVLAVSPDARLIEAAAEVVRQFDLWSEDANDGTYAYYRSDGLMTACVALRAAVRAAGKEKGA